MTDAEPTRSRPCTNRCARRARGRGRALDAELVQVAPGIRVLALRTPTLPPAAHTNVYLVGPEIGPVAWSIPASPYPDQQAVLDEALVGASRDRGRRSSRITTAITSAAPRRSRRAGASRSRRTPRRRAGSTGIVEVTRLIEDGRVDRTA